MSHNTNFSASHNLAMPGSGLASRRGGQAIKPLSIDAIKPGADKDGSLVTPRTSRSHLLAGLRTAPKSATVATFPQSPTAATAMNQQSRNGTNSHRNMSPPRRIDSTTPSSDHAPLPPPSANAFRRGHKKSSSLFNGANLLDANGAASANAQDMPKSAGPKTATFPPNTMQAGTYGPGQARAGQHPIRQPRGPPNFDELASKPTSKHEGSKNFATRTRRSAVHNLVRAGFSRRQVTASGSSGSISPISETAEEQEQEHDQDQDLATPLTDDESVSGRSGSGSLNGDDVECSLPSSRTSTGSWGAIGSERPGSREKSITRKSVESLNSTAASDNESVSGSAIPGSFASVFKSVKPTAGSQQRKAPMVLMKNMEKRRFAA
ncbi:hypothetical protein F503_04014 [Ophiostoma piceae UAMH 11346]|uniref:Uncharacterized protein n=1 Tax=Ophiostoma piceae (strain UAMH 11346) TaxID=1262450 RepID=S3CPZ7_OPHP1|nr:hypothetical protein F503_04014 [Ophiostoma piceae UAMH 11346]